MRNKYFTFLFLCVIFSIHAQNYVIEYQVANIFGGDNGREFLIFNNSDSYYFDYVERDHLPIEEILKNYNIQRGGQKMYRNLNKKNEIIRLKNLPNKGKELHYILDKKPEISWTIVKGSKNILNKVCKNAIGYFRGRKYSVWFTTEIGTSLGPWKLDGLPGIILEAEDLDGICRYEAIKISNQKDLRIPKTVLDFVKNYNIGEIIQYKDFINLQNIYLKDMQQKGIANLPKGLSASDSINIRDLEREKSFEWEIDSIPNK